MYFRCLVTCVFVTGMWSVHQQQRGDKAGQLVEQVPGAVGALLRPAAQEELQEPGGGGAGGHPQPSGQSAVSRVRPSVLKPGFSSYAFTKD